MAVQALLYRIMSSTVKWRVRQERIGFVVGTIFDNATLIIPHKKWGPILGPHFLFLTDYAISTFFDTADVGSLNCSPGIFKSNFLVVVARPPPN